MTNIFRMYHLVPPDGVGAFYVALVIDEPVLSTRSGSWAPETILGIDDIICPAQGVLYEWDVKIVDASEAPALPTDQVTVATILPKLPADAQSWISSMTPGEFNGTQAILNTVGVDSFIANWEYHRDHLEEIRQAFG